MTPQSNKKRTTKKCNRFIATFKQICICGEPIFVDDWGAYSIQEPGIVICGMCADDEDKHNEEVHRTSRHIID